MIMTDFEAYRMYLALRAHFQTDDYDAIKMRGRVRASRSSFVNTGKEQAFKKLVKKYKDQEICDFFLANFVSGDRWGGVFDGEALDVYRRWLARNESLRYRFSQDLCTLDTEMQDLGLTDIGQALTSDQGQHPLIVRCYLRKTVEIETLVILDKLLGWREKVDEACTDTVIWPDLSRLIRKYSPFLRINQDEFRTILERHT